MDICADTIIRRASLLHGAGWHPNKIVLKWWGDEGWTLEIGMADWIELGIPLAELPAVSGLPARYAPHPASIRPGPMRDHPGVTISGGSRAPDYSEALPEWMGEDWHAEAARIIDEVHLKCHGHPMGASHSPREIDGRCGTPYRRHSAVCYRWWWQDWEDETRARYPDLIRQHFAQRAAAREARQAVGQPTPDDPIAFDGRRMMVWRPCGCVTQHWTAPGKGIGDNASKRRFGDWLALRPCQNCETI